MWLSGASQRAPETWLCGEMRLFLWRHVGQFTFSMCPYLKGNGFAGARQCASERRIILSWMLLNKLYSGRIKKKKRKKISSNRNFFTPLPISIDIFVFCNMFEMNNLDKSFFDFTILLISENCIKIDFSLNDRTMTNRGYRINFNDDKFGDIINEWKILLINKLDNFGLNVKINVCVWQWNSVTAICRRHEVTGDRPGFHYVLEFMCSIRIIHPILRHDWNKMG